MRALRTKIGTALALAGSALLALALVAPGADAQQPPQGDPPGNNGTVKIDGVPFDSHPDNEPHPGCIFEVDFYGYDEGDLSAFVTFEAIAPTPGGTLTDGPIDIGEDAAGGGTDLDADRQYDLSALLSGITPHPQQGHHVKLTVNADGSQGADVKHKVFWVECEAASATTTTTSTSTTTTSTTSTTTTTTTSTTVPGVSATTTPTTAAAQVAPQVVTRPPAPPAPQVAGEVIERPVQAAPAEVARAELPVTGTSTGTSAGLLVAAGVALLLGGSLIGLADRLHLRAAP